MAHAHVMMTHLSAMTAKVNPRTNLDVKLWTVASHSHFVMARVVVVAHPHTHAIGMLVEAAIVKVAARRTVMSHAHPRVPMMPMLRQAHFHIHCDFRLRAVVRVVVTVMSVRPMR